MFEEFGRELSRLHVSQGVRIPIDLPLDDKGYLDRKCPHQECRANFKVIFDDWRDKVPEEAAYCAKCGERSEPSGFNTDWQQDHIARVAKAYITDQVNRAFSRAARRTRARSISAGLSDIRMSVSYHAGTTPVVLPPVADEALRQDFMCELCSCRYSTLGAGFFCPACGHTSALRDFDHTIDTALKALRAMGAIKSAIAQQYDDDIAANVEQQILEDQVENVVTAMQRVTEALFRKLTNAGSYTWDHNLFQRLADASNLWRQATGTGYECVLNPQELATLETMIQRRHKLGHCQGIVDQRYIDKSGDTTYGVGQRLVIKRTHVESLAETVSKLVGGLRERV